MGTGTPVVKGEIITHTKMNLKLETVSGGLPTWPLKDLNTEYQNLTGRALFCTVVAQFIFPVPGQYAELVFEVGCAPDDEKFVSAFLLRPTVISNEVTITVCGLVPDIAYYRCSLAGDATLTWFSWSETSL